MKRGTRNLRRLQRLVDKYLRHFAPHRRAEWERFSQMPDLNMTMRNAALARRADGKCEAHQRRVGLTRLEPFEQSLQKARDAIAQCRTFEDLHAIISEHRTEGVGLLTVYDTAVRIGACLGLAPAKVYLHTGTRKGAKALGLDVSSGYIEPNGLPLPLRRLSPDETEGFLCIFKDAFRGRSHLRGCTPQRRRGSIC